MAEGNWHQGSIDGQSTLVLIMRYDDWKTHNLDDELMESGDMIDEWGILAAEYDEILLKDDKSDEDWQRIEHIEDRVARRWGLDFLQSWRGE